MTLMSTYLPDNVVDPLGEVVVPLGREAGVSSRIASVVQGGPRVLNLPTFYLKVYRTLPILFASPNLVKAMRS